MFFRDINIYGVVAIRSSDTVYELESHDLRMLSEPPDVGLIARKTGAVNS